MRRTQRRRRAIKRPIPPLGRGRRHFPVENPGAHVAGSGSITTERPGTPPHGEAAASGVFANSAAGSAIPDTPQIAIDDFVKVDLRVAQIVVAERIPKADKLLRLEVDLGYEKRQILSGIAEWYSPEELVGRRIVVIANLAPRKMRGLESAWDVARGIQRGEWQAGAGDVRGRDCAGVKVALAAYVPTSQNRDVGHPISRAAPKEKAASLRE